MAGMFCFWRTGLSYSERRFRLFGCSYSQNHFCRCSIALRTKSCCCRTSRCSSHSETCEGCYVFEEVVAAVQEKSKANDVFLDLKHEIIIMPSHHMLHIPLHARAAC